MEQVGAYGDVSRDSEKRVISVAFYIKSDSQTFVRAYLPLYEKYRKTGNFTENELFG